MDCKMHIQHNSKLTCYRVYMNRSPQWKVILEMQKSGARDSLCRKDDTTHLTSHTQLQRNKQLVLGIK